MKSVIPWVLVVALLGGVYFLYSVNRDKEAQVARLSLESQEADKLRAENEELRKLPAQAAELTRLRKENEDLLRLRSEAQRLRSQTKLLEAQLAAAQAQGAQAQGTQAQQAEQQLKQLAAENQELRGQALKNQENHAVTCIGILRMIDGAKQQWALENKQPSSATPTIADLLPYLGPGAENKLMCPDGGAYTINNMQTLPTCSVAGHALH